MLMLGMEDADGKNSLLAGRTTTDVGDVGAALKLTTGEPRVAFDHSAMWLLT